MPSPVRRLPLPLLACLVLVAWPAASVQAARCVDEDGAAPRNETASTADARSPASPRDQLLDLVQRALNRSRSVGAARLLAEAAESDTDEARAARSLTASAQGQLGASAATQQGVPNSSGGQARAGISVSQLLYDGGRSDRLVDWRARQAEAAQQGVLSLQEQVALQTLSLSVERHRYRVQTQVYQQYARKMSCLVEALEQIVAADRGRASELVQAKKTLQQTELSVAQSQSQQRLIEIDLRRLAGDPLPPAEGLWTALMNVPPVDEVRAHAERAPDLVAMDRQAQALASFADAQAAQNKPQLSWQVTGSKAVGLGSPGNVGVGLAINVPLVSPGAAPATSAARKRAEAARLQREDTLDQRIARMASAHEQATAAFDRARDVAEVLKNSDRVRGFTLQQWQQLGKRSLFDVMSAEGDHYTLRVAYVNALHDGQIANALLHSLGAGVSDWLK